MSARVEYQSTRRYPYLPICDFNCGTQFWGYVSYEAAQSIADNHECPVKKSGTDEKMIDAETMCTNPYQVGDKK